MQQHVFIMSLLRIDPNVSLLHCPLTKCGFAAVGMLCMLLVLLLLSLLLLLLSLLPTCC
jgi:hypothetical protein